MLTIMSRRTPTAKDRKKAQTLKTLWEARKHDLDLTQNSASKELGLTQPTFSQYLNAIIPLNTDIIFKFAKLLQVTPQTVDPTLINISALMGIDSAAARFYFGKKCSRPSACNRKQPTCRTNLRWYSSRHAKLY